MLKKKIKIVLNSYNSKDLEFAFKVIQKSFLVTDAIKNIKYFSLPIKSSYYSILRSPHTDKDSQEQFEKLTYKKIIFADIENLNKTLELLSKIEHENSFNFTIDLFENVNF